MILRTQYQVSKKSKRNQRAGSPSIYANPQGIYAYVYVHMLGHFKKQWKTQGQPQSRYHEHICWSYRAYMLLECEVVVDSKKKGDKPIIIQKEWEWTPNNGIYAAYMRIILIWQ